MHGVLARGKNDLIEDRKVEGIFLGLDHFPGDTTEQGVHIGLFHFLPNWLHVLDRCQGRVLELPGSHEKGVSFDNELLGVLIFGQVRNVGVHLSQDGDILRCHVEDRHGTDVTEESKYVWNVKRENSPVGGMGDTDKEEINKRSSGKAMCDPKTRSPTAWNWPTMIGSYPEHGSWGFNLLRSDTSEQLAPTRPRCRYRISHRIEIMSSASFSSQYTVAPSSTSQTKQSLNSL